MTKKYGGRLERWWKVPVPEYADRYGPNLGFVVMGRLGDDPTGRGFGEGLVQTSLVVTFSSVRIETLNTIYDLGKPRV